MTGSNETCHELLQFVKTRVMSRKVSRSLRDIPPDGMTVTIEEKK